MSTVSLSTVKDNATSLEDVELQSRQVNQFGRLMVTEAGLRNMVKTAIAERLREVAIDARSTDSKTARLELTAWMITKDLRMKFPQLEIVHGEDSRGYDALVSEHGVNNVATVRPVAHEIMADMFRVLNGSVRYDTDTEVVSYDGNSALTYYVEVDMGATKPKLTVTDNDGNTKSNTLQVFGKNFGVSSLFQKFTAMLPGGNNTDSDS